MIADGIIDLSISTTRTRSSSRPADTKRKSFILNIPTEILYKILSLVCGSFHGTQVKYKDAGGKPRSLAQPLILRQVSTKFRSVANGLDFWYQDHFDFKDLVNVGFNANPSRSIDRKSFLTGKLIKILLADEHFAFCLGSRKTDWKFSALETIRAVLDNVPLVVQNIRTVMLHNIPDNNNIAIEQLRECKFLTNLLVDSHDDIGTIDLNLIGCSHPLLRELRLARIYSYEGSLINLKNLQTFYIAFVSPAMKSVTTSLIPKNSATTLTNLSIFNAPVPPEADCNLRLLKSFVNLNCLHFEPFTQSLSELVINAQFKLKVFSTAITLDSNFEREEFLSMFSAKSLERLDQFSLSARFPRSFCCKRGSVQLSDHQILEFCERNEQIVQVITIYLRSLRVLRLSMLLMISWCRFFARLTSLKLLDCDILPSLLFHDYWGPVNSDMELRMGLTEGFDAAFASFIEKPRVEIWMANDYKHLMYT
jgi:hypothetical protein